MRTARKHTRACFNLLREAIKNTARGFAIGAANLIPGVSGATIALILGIYERLICELAGLFAPPQRFVALRANLTRDWGLLIPLGIGIGIAVIAGSYLIPGLIRSYPLIVFSIVSGLIASSAFVIGKTVRSGSVAWLILGAMIGAGIAMTPVGIEVSTIPLLTMLAGALAIASMIIPGISGSYVLLLLGYYTHVLDAIRAIDLGFLALFGLGALFGAIGAFLFVSHVLARYRSTTMLVLIGLIIGSLGKPLSIAMNATQSSGDWFVLSACFAIGAVITMLIAHPHHSEPERS
jgi:putative membrane protein